MKGITEYGVDIDYYKGLHGKEAVKERLNGRQPLIIIHGEVYFVKVHFGILEPAGNYFLDNIKIHDLKKDPVTRKLCFYYDLKTKARTSVAPDITDFPPDVVRIEIPNSTFLDPVGVARMNGRAPEDYHFYGVPLKMYRVAKVIPLKNTELVDLVRSNCKKLGIDPPKSIKAKSLPVLKRKGTGL